MRGIERSSFGQPRRGRRREEEQTDLNERY